MTIKDAFFAVNCKWRERLVPTAVVPCSAVSKNAFNYCDLSDAQKLRILSQEPVRKTF
jgi:hypothetical protein